MGSRRGFLKSLFGAPVAAAAWATVAKAETPKKLERPNCLLAEQDEVWTLESGVEIPVRRIEVRLDFMPAVTWEIRHEGRVFRRVVIPRLTERELRVSKALRNKGHDPLYSSRQLVPVKTVDEMKDYDEARSIIVSSEGDTATPLADLIRERMDDCLTAWNAGGWAYSPTPEGGRPEPQGAFVVIETPEATQYGIGVTGYTITSDAMLIQAPAGVLFR